VFDCHESFTWLLPIGAALLHAAAIECSLHRRHVAAACNSAAPDSRQPRNWFVTVSAVQLTRNKTTTIAFRPPSTAMWQQQKNYIRNDIVSIKCGYKITMSTLFGGAGAVKAPERFRAKKPTARFSVFSIRATGVLSLTLTCLISGNKNLLANSFWGKLETLWEKSPMPKKWLYKIL